MTRPVDEVTRFSRFVRPGIGFDACWIWTASLSRGYGQFRDARGKVVKAHRFSYERAVGPVPVGLELDHLCHNRACVNPNHLEPVTHALNMQRMREHHRSAAA